MNPDDFESEYEPFYDFSGTYEDNFVGKTLDDFDLNEELVAKPLDRVEMKQIKEEDDDWEDIDVEDGAEESK